MSARRARRQDGFTLAFTMMLVVVLSVMATAIIARMWSSLRGAGFAKERQNTMDAAAVGLSMALDEISPGVERMRNTVWSTMTSNGTITTATTSYLYAMNQLDRTGSATTSQPVREIGLFGNIRNWEPFADWNQAYGTAAWTRGWTYVPNDTSLQYFDDTETAKVPVQVSNTNTTGAYWYRQIVPAMPGTIAGAPTAPTAWPNRLTEYSDGIFMQPVLKKVYTVRSSPRTRVAVYVQMSLQDYYDPQTVGTVTTYNNVGLADKTLASATSSTFNKVNYLERNNIVFSIFAVSETTRAARGVRLHQSLNVAMGGAEYLSGGGKCLDTPTMQASGTAPLCEYRVLPYFPPSLDTPRGDNILIAGTPVSGQVYPASCDLRFKFPTSPATESTLFLYERIDLPRDAATPAASGNPKVVFLIERVDPGVSLLAYPTYRRRLIYDWPDAIMAYYYQFGGTTGNAADLNPESAICWADASISAAAQNSVGTGSGTVKFPGMYRYAGREAPPHALSPFYLVNIKDWFDEAFNPTNNTKDQYPYTARISATGSFAIATSSAPADCNLMNWPNSPLAAWDSFQQTFGSTPLDATLPWQGPTVAIRHADPSQDATVSYYVTWWPHRVPSNKFAVIGPRLGLSFQAATHSIR